MGMAFVSMLKKIFMLVDALSLKMIILIVIPGPSNNDCTMNTNVRLFIKLNNECPV